MTKLAANGYPDTFLKRATRKIEKRQHRQQRQQIEEEDKITSRKTVAIPYIKGTREEIRRVLAPLSVRTAFKSNNRKWTLMGRAKDTPPADSQPGVVYAIGCADCEQIYVEETARTGRERLKEHNATHA